jgi:hypothetical protein
VAEQGCLLSSYPDKIGIGGSNPPLSATSQIIRAFRIQIQLQEISPPQTLRPASITMNGKIESRERSGPADQSSTSQTLRYLPRLARAAPQEF